MNTAILAHSHIHVITYIPLCLNILLIRDKCEVPPTLKGKILHEGVTLRMQDSLGTLSYYFNFNTLTCKGLLPHQLFIEEPFTECFLMADTGAAILMSERGSDAKNHICHWKDFGFYAKRKKSLESFE